MPHPGARRRLAGSAAALAALGAAVWLALGMGRGLLLSSDILGWVWPWGGLVLRSPLQAPALSDPLWQFVPWWDLARRELLSGRLPLWNPHQDAGVPLLGNALGAFGSPFVWPILAGGVAKGLHVSLLLRVLFAAAAAAAWLRSLGRSSAAAAAGGVAYALSGPFVAWLLHAPTTTAPAIPLLLLFGARLTRGGRFRDFAGLAAATYLVLAGGHPETWLMALLVAAAVVLLEARSAVAVARPLGGALLGAGLAAPLVFPFVEYYLESASRLGADRHLVVLRLRGLLRFLLPHADASHPIEGAATVSVTLLLLAACGLFLGRRRPDVRFWGAAALLFVAASFDGPFARLLASRTPVYWSRSLLLLPLPLGFLAALALDELRARFPRAARLAWAVPVLVSGELLLAARGVHAVTPPAALFPRSPLLAAAANDPRAGHVLPLHSFLPANAATVAGLYDLRGYDALSPRAFRARREAIGRFRPLPVTSDAIEPWDLARGGAALDEWSVTHLMLHPQFAFSAPVLNERLGLDLEEVYSGPDGRLLRNRRARPPARLEPDGEARVAVRVPGRWEVETDAERPATLVVADAAYPGWVVEVDGARVTAPQETGAPFRVGVGAGRHRVVLRYACPPFRAGLAVAGASALVLAGLALLSRRRESGPVGGILSVTNRVRRNR